MMTEPDVTITDFLLTVECAIFAVLTFRYGKPSQPLRSWFSLFFMSTAMGALSGGLVHGFFLDRQTLGYNTLWPTTLIAIGFSAFTVWIIGAHIKFSMLAMRWMIVISGMVLLIYIGIVIFVSQAFLVAIAYYLPAGLFLLVILVLEYRELHEPRILFAATGIGLSFVAAIIQQGGIGLHPVYFNHNALYHLIQALALFMIFLGGLWFVSKQPEVTGSRHGEAETA